MATEVKITSFDNLDTDEGIVWVTSDGADYKAIANAAIGPLSLLLRDGNGMAALQNLGLPVSQITASAVPISLNTSAAAVFILTGDQNQIFEMPDATTLPVNSTYLFLNNSIEPDCIGLVNSYGGEDAITSFGNQSVSFVYLVDNSTSGGEWVGVNIVSGNSGINRVGTFNSQPVAANGATIVDDQIYFQEAGPTGPGMITEGDQVLAGNKVLAGYLAVESNSLIPLYSSYNGGQGTALRGVVIRQVGAGAQSINNVCGAVIFGADGTTTSGIGAAVVAKADATWSDSSHPTRLELQVAVADQLTPEKVLTLNSDLSAEFVAQTRSQSFRFTQSSTPASQTATGSAGQMAYDTSYFYLCTATNNWTRVPLTWNNSSLPGLVYSQVATDGTDQTAVLQAEIDSLHDNGGGTLLLPTGYILIEGVINFPNDGNTMARQAPITIIGMGKFWDTGEVLNIAVPAQGTVLRCTATDSYGKFRTLGLGVLTFENVTFWDDSGDDTPFLYTTNTTLHIEKNSFVGSKSRTACDQDAIICGGTTTVTQSNGLDDAFQGYGTIIRGNYFNGIRRAVYGRTFFNGNTIESNTVWNNCGSDLTNNAAFELDGLDSNCIGNIFVNNLVEVYGYNYAFKCAKAQQNSFVNNGIFDAFNGRTVAGVYFTSTGLYNKIFEGYTVSSYGVVGMVDDSNTNMYLTSQQSVYSVYRQPSKFLSISYPNEFASAKFSGGVTGSPEILIQNDTARGGSSVQFQIKRSAAEVSNPNARVCEVQSGGQLILGGASSGDVYFYDQDGTTLKAGFLTSGKKWYAAGTGGNMEINSGTGGSYLKLYNYGIQCYSHTGTLQATIGAGINGIYLGNLTDTPVQKAAIGIVNVGKLAVTNTAAATTPGTVTRKMEVFDSAGNSLGFIAIYDSIS